MTALLPDDETDRLAAVRRYDVLDTPPDGAFDRVTALAARICHAPISTVTIVDEDRIWFKSTHGIDVDEIGRDPGLCASAIMQPGPWIVTDAETDVRTLVNPLVRGELGLRFYVGVPLTTSDGYRLGTLNVIDVEPREVTPDEVACLEDLAQIVVDELELRLAARREVPREAARRAASFRQTIMDAVSHELRTPLAVLRGLATLDPDDVDVADLQQMMRRRVAHLDWLISQYLDFTALEDGRPLALSREPADPAAIAEAAIDVFGPGAPITLEVSGDRRCVCNVNRTRQILTELLNNAIRHSGPDGGVTVRIEARSADRVEFSVTDDGSGIPPDRLDTLFTRVDVGARGEGGPGIGLYVCRALAEAQAGSLTVESTVGVGSRFTLSLPPADH